MLQRKQTLYMLASVIAILTMFLKDLAVAFSPDATFSINALGIVSLTEGVELDTMRYGTLFLLLLMLGLPLFSIFCYKKRKWQIRLLIYAALLDVLFIPYFCFFEFGVCSDLILATLKATGLQEIKLESDVQLLTAVVMPLFSVFCSVMAIRGVRYDIALLAAADRLRPSR